MPKTTSKVADPNAVFRHFSDDVPERMEFLVRVSVVASAGESSPELPTIPGWDRESSVVDSDMRVRYAMYRKFVHQDLDGDGPDIDRIADVTSEVEHYLETILLIDGLEYEKKVYLITQPIAAWSK
jgi:hypothetical protein